MWRLNRIYWYFPINMRNLLDLPHISASKSPHIDIDAGIKLSLINFPESILNLCLKNKGIFINQFSPGPDAGSLHTRNNDFSRHVFGYMIGKLNWLG